MWRGTAVGVYLLILVSAMKCSSGQDWPPFPVGNADVEIPAQEWPMRPGLRTVRIRIHFPDGHATSVNSETGLMLTLHNWGGTDCVGTADPAILARELNVVAVCVNYLQSGPEDSIEAPEPYDFGYLQSLDALRALWYVRSSLQQQEIVYADERIFCTGGSGGGNVTLMANKLAPRTFTCVIDMCGMKKLSDDIAFGLPGGSDLNARWNLDPAHANYLSIDAQELRFIGHPNHLETMTRLGTCCRIVVVHGVDDQTCPHEDAVEMVNLMEDAKHDVKAVFVTADMLDGTIFQSTGHSLGDRTGIVLSAGGELLKPSGRQSLRRSGPTDFDLKESVNYRTTNGVFVISFEKGYPESSFQIDPAPPVYQSHRQLLNWADAAGQLHRTGSDEEWSIRKSHIRRHLESVMGPLPSPISRSALKPEIIKEVLLLPPAVRRPVLRRTITYQSEPGVRVPAYVMIPVLDSDHPADQLFPAVLCLQQTTEVGKDEPAGVRGDPELKYALELAELGFVTLTLDYPSFGEYKYDFSASARYSSGSMKAIWDNIRGLDYLETLPEVDAARIGCIGHSLGGHNAIFTSIFEPRLKAIVSSCGFSSLAEDDVASWTGPRYMPRIATEFANDAGRVPFDFHELIGSIAPRPFMACIAERDDDFAAAGVRDVLASAETVYRLLGALDNLQAVTADVPHSFPEESRRKAYDFLRRHLGPIRD